MVIMYVRHAEDIDDELTELGIMQCQLAVKNKEKTKFSKIYTSNAKRCVDTAKFFAEAYKIPVEESSSLNEREVLPDKYPKNEAEQLWYDNYMNPYFSNKFPEGCKEYLDRNFAEFDKMVKRHLSKDENVIVVGHSSTLYALYCYIHGLGNEKDLVWSRAGNCSKVYFEIKQKVDYAKYF